MSSDSSDLEPDDEQSLSVPLAPEAAPARARSRVRSIPPRSASASASESASSSPALGVSELLGARFRRAWSALPAADGLERDADVALTNVRLLAGFGALCVFVFSLPTLLAMISPEAAAVVPGTAPRLSEGASVIYGESGAVAADVGVCSKLGVRVLRELGGNAVDAAVSVMLCQGVLSPFASGIGGGCFMLVHFVGNATKRAATEFVDARETAPSGVDKGVYVRNETASRLGGAAVAVPGELRGLELAHRRWGRVSWERLVTPVVELAEEAVVGPMLARRLVQMNETIFASPSLAAVFTKDPPKTAASLLGLGGGVASPSPSPSPSPGAVASAELPPAARAAAEPDPDPVGGKEELGSALVSPAPVANVTPGPVQPAARVLLKEGDKLRNPVLVATLRSIARFGADHVYKDLAQDLADEVRAAGGTLSPKDLRSYRPVLRAPVESFYEGFKVLGGPPPSAGGPSIAMALNILEGLQFHRYGRNGPTYLKLVEAIKYVFAARSKLGDPAFVKSVPKTVSRMLSKRAAMTVRAWMDAGSSKTHDPSHYSADGIVRAAQRESGTAHVSIVDKENNAVSVTSTINLPFGAGFMSAKTGILYNNQMDDFSTAPNRPNAFGLYPSPQNKIEPGKRPLSSMAPTIIMHNNLPYLVIGGSGGPRIITATLQSIVNVIDWGDVLGDALSAPRLHHQLVPNVLWMESVQAETCELYRALQRPSGTTPGGSWAYWPSVCKALKSSAHNVSGPSLDGCVQAVQVVAGRGPDGTAVRRRVYAASDPRKIGLASAY
jgi:gamma-glutamyltranspeptidase